MPIPVTCPNCHRTFRVPDRFAGHRGYCPDCRAVIAIPDEGPAQLESMTHDPVPGDEPEPEPYPRRPRREALRRPSPRDHLPAWRRVATGFLVQQGAAALLFIGLVLIGAGAVALADDPGNFQDEPNTPQVVAASLGMLAQFVGFAVQVVGRLLSASTPVRAPRGLGILSAVASVLALLGWCVIGFFVALTAVEQEQGGGGDEAMATLAGLCVLGWMFLVAGGECLHGFAVGAVGRVLRADGARTLGNGMGIGVALLGLLSIFAFCGLSAWIGNNNPQNPEPDAEQQAALIGWVVGTGVLATLYLMLDIVLLQQGRRAVARIAADAEADADGRWD